MQEYPNGLPFSSLGDLPDSGIEPAFPALIYGFFTTATREDLTLIKKGKPWRSESPGG